MNEVSVYHAQDFLFCAIGAHAIKLRVLPFYNNTTSLVKILVVEALRGKSKVNSKSDGEVAMFDSKPVKEVCQINSPCTVGTRHI